MAPLLEPALRTIVLRREAATIGITASEARRSAWKPVEGGKGRWL
jgi:hypothetical protein